MARRKHHSVKKGLMYDLRKMVKQAANIGGTVVVSLPVTYPMAKAGYGMVKGMDAKTAGNLALWEGLGIGTGSGGYALNGAKMGEVVIRDIVFVIGGTILRKLAKRI